MSNVNFTLRAEDDRPAIVLDDVKEGSFKRVTVEGCEGEKIKGVKTKN